MAIEAAEEGEEGDGEGEGGEGGGEVEGKGGGNKVLYGVDATKLGKGGKEIRKGGWDRIVFNFPHVGGVTRDVNRQVRYNQGMCVGRGYFGALCVC